MASGSTPIYGFPYPIATDPVNVHEDIEALAESVESEINGAGFVTLTGTQTLTNKTLTSPKINENVQLTATATELNILDGATLTTAELNYVDGVTSAIQTQIDGKASLSGATFTGNVNLTSGNAYKINSVNISAALPGLTWGELKDGKSGLTIG